MPSHSNPLSNSFLHLSSLEVVPVRRPQEAGRHGRHAADQRRGLGAAVERGIGVAAKETRLQRRLEVQAQRTFTCTHTHTHICLHTLAHLMIPEAFS
jgi:hypothetical protein